MRNRFSLPASLCAEYGLHAYGGIRIGFHAGIFGSDYMIDEQVVIAALKVEMCREPFVFVKQLLAVGKVTPDAHIRLPASAKPR